jgi:hypothetical protein
MKRNDVMTDFPKKIRKGITFDKMTKAELLLLTKWIIKQLPKYPSV